MIDMLQNAKDLIAKGKALNDPELITMGMELLEQYQPQTKEQYVCQNCGHTMDVDKPRKRCPKCKKHKLIIEKPNQQPQQTEQHPQPQQQTLTDFNVQIRNKTRVHYNENGEVDGTIMRVEKIDPSQITNVWNDTGEFKDDKANEQLKKLTVRSARTRPPAKMVKAVCTKCGNVQYLNPLHLSGKSRYLCDKCIIKSRRR